jgi:hypothetical protein
MMAAVAVKAAMLHPRESGERACFIVLASNY